MKRAWPFLAVLAAAAVFSQRWTIVPERPTRPEGFLEAEVAGIMGGPMGMHGAVILVPRMKGPATRVMAIVVGGTEGSSIQLALAHEHYPRPLTHDLLMTMAERFDAKVRALYIHSMQRDTYFARLETERGGKLYDFDCRPSDGIAIALRAGAPIWIKRDVFDRAAVNLPAPIKEGNRGGGI